MHGRRIIRTDEAVITRDNVVKVLTDALSYHIQNRSEIDYLWKYYKGEHPIQNRVKEVRPEICNKVSVNVAYEIVSFDTGYLMGEPVQFISRNNETSDDITKLNDYMMSEEKFSKDKETADWFHICGTAFRMALPSEDEYEDESPFNLYVLDPRNTFVVYHNGLGEKPVLGVRYVTDSNGIIHYSCYSADRYYEITNTNTIVSEQPHDLGMVPIIEYPLNRARLGVFEIVLDLLDAIDLCDSNRMDGVEQFVQSLMLFHNMDISQDDFDSLREMGAIKFKDIDPQMKASVTYITNELSQGETQVLVDHMYDMVLTICGIPNRKASTAAGDNGIAVVYRDGWQAAETNARGTEASFKRSERQLLRLVTRICSAIDGMALKPWDVGIQFTRRNYENTLAKAQVLQLMLSNPKIHPKLAFDHSGMFVDPDMAYQMSLEYEEENQNAPTVNAGADSGNRADPVQGSESGDTDRARTDNNRRDSQENA